MNKSAAGRPRSDLETDAAAVGRVGRRGVDRAVSVRRVVALERRSITKMLALPPCWQIMITRCPSGESAAQRVMPGKIADDFALAGLDVEQEHARRARP